ncbi:MAG: FHA domain-containing protein [Planctomycetota bacterium]|nr:MAG: FHA domain-containing protein [Planctomycetota bacterium]
MAFKLSYVTADGSYRAYDLMKIKDSLIIGRDRQMSKLVIPDSQVSRSHCAISRNGKKFYVEDLGSRNGTWVNQQRIDKMEVRSGDVIRIGGVDLHLGSESKADASGHSDPLLGRNLGGFELMEILGRGSYGTVYRGLQVALGRPVAIKVLADRHQRQPEQVQLFLNEARAAGRLNHPNVVQVHDVREVEGFFLLIMELVTGGSMADRLRIEGPLGDEVICSIIEDIGHALGYAESQRLVHRDVKPDNILSNTDGVFKLADLGIAAPISDDGHARQAKAFGSAHYVAPEQARGGNIDGRADIYALGASAWHLATGRTMFEGTARQIVSSHMNDERPDLAPLAPNCSPELRQLINQMISRDPEERPRSGNDVAAQARAIREGTAAPASRRMPTVASGRRRVRRVRSRRRRR